MSNFAVLKLLAILGAVSALTTTLVINVSAFQIDSCHDPTPVYTVQQDDKLYEIGIRYGDIRFWESIYIANADLIDDPDLIYAGQQFEIPPAVYSYKSSDVTVEAVLSNPFCDAGTLPISSIDFSRLALYSLDYFDSRQETDEQHAGSGDRSGDEEERLAEFREAFNSVTKSVAGGKDGRVPEKDNNVSTQQDSVQQQSERRILMEIDGMVLDETRSKVGRDFYDVFYTNWQQPPDTYNFSIRIAEQPSPSLGTIIYVEVNDTETFRMRLQPRYDFIQQAGKYAVRQTYSYLQTNDHRLQIY